MTNDKLKTVLQDCKASVLFEMEQAICMDEEEKVIKLNELLDDVDEAIGCVDGDTITEEVIPEVTTTKVPVDKDLEYNHLEYLHSTLKL